MPALAPFARSSRASRTGAVAASTWKVTEEAPASTYPGAQRSGSSIIRWQSSGVSVAFASASTTGMPSVRFGTKWLSMTSTWSQSALETRRASVAKSEASMLGEIWIPMTWGILGVRIRGWLRALSLVPVGPLEQRADVEHRVVDPGVEVAELGVPLRDRGDGEVARLHVVDLVPPDGRGDGRLRVAAHGVGARDRVVAGVLVVVDEELARVSVLAPPRRGHEVGCAAFDLAREGECCPSYVGEAMVGLDPHVDVNAVPARRLRPADRPQLVEDLVGDVGDAAHGVEGAVRHRVEVDAPL